MNIQALLIQIHPLPHNNHKMVPLIKVRFSPTSPVVTAAVFL